MLLVVPRFLQPWAGEYVFLSSDKRREIGCEGGENPDLAAEKRVILSEILDWKQSPPAVYLRVRSPSDPVVKAPNPAANQLAVSANIDAWVKIFKPIDLVSLHHAHGDAFCPDALLHAMSGGVGGGDEEDPGWCSMFYSPEEVHLLTLYMMRVEEERYSSVMVRGQSSVPVPETLQVIDRFICAFRCLLRFPEETIAASAAVDQAQLQATGGELLALANDHMRLVVQHWAKERFDNVRVSLRAAAACYKAAEDQERWLWTECLKERMLGDECLQPLYKASLQKGDFERCIRLTREAYSHYLRYTSNTHRTGAQLLLSLSGHKPAELEKWEHHALKKVRAAERKVFALSCAHEHGSGRLVLSRAIEQAEAHRSRTKELCVAEKYGEANARLALAQSGYAFVADHWGMYRLASDPPEAPPPPPDMQVFSSRIMRMYARSLAKVLGQDQDEAHWAGAVATGCGWLSDAMRAESRAAAETRAAAAAIASDDANDVGGRTESMLLPVDTTLEHLVEQGFVEAAISRLRRSPEHLPARSKIVELVGLLLKAGMQAQALLNYDATAALIAGMEHASMSPKQGAPSSGSTSNSNKVRNKALAEDEAVEVAEAATAAEIVRLLERMATSKMSRTRMVQQGLVPALTTAANRARSAASGWPCSEGESIQVAIVHTLCHVANGNGPGVPCMSLVRKVVMQGGVRCVGELLKSAVLRAKPAFVLAAATCLAQLLPLLVSYDDDDNGDGEGGQQQQRRQQQEAKTDSLDGNGKEGSEEEKAMAAAIEQLVALSIPTLMVTAMKERKIKGKLDLQAAAAEALVAMALLPPLLPQLSATDGVTVVRFAHIKAKKAQVKQQPGDGPEALALAERRQVELTERLHLSHTALVRATGAQAGGDGEYSKGAWAIKEKRRIAERARATAQARWDAEAAKVEAERLVLEEKEQGAAATRIQCRLRTRNAQRELQQKGDERDGEAATAIQTRIRQREAKKVMKAKIRDQEDRHATVIQSRIRAIKAKETAKLRKEELRIAGMSREERIAELKKSGFTGSALYKKEQEFLRLQEEEILRQKAEKKRKKVEAVELERWTREQQEGSDVLRKGMKIAGRYCILRVRRVLRARVKPKKKKKKGKGEVSEPEEPEEEEDLRLHFSAYDMKAKKIVACEGTVPRLHLPHFEVLYDGVTKGDWMPLQVVQNQAIQQLERLWLQEGQELVTMNQLKGEPRLGFTTWEAREEVRLHLEQTAATKLQAVHRQRKRKDSFHGKKQAVKTLQEAERKRAKAKAEAKAAMEKDDLTVVRRRMPDGDEDEGGGRGEGGYVKAVDGWIRIEVESEPGASFPSYILMVQAKATVVQMKRAIEKVEGEIPAVDQRLTLEPVVVKKKRPKSARPKSAVKKKKSKKDKKDKKSKAVEKEAPPPPPEEEEAELGEEMKDKWTVAVYKLGDGSKIMLGNRGAEERAAKAKVDAEKAAERVEKDRVLEEYKKSKAEGGVVAATEGEAEKGAAAGEGGGAPGELAVDTDIDVLLDLPKTTKPLSPMEKRKALVLKNAGNIDELRRQQAELITQIVGVGYPSPKFSLLEKTYMKLSDRIEKHPYATAEMKRTSKKAGKSLFEQLAIEDAARIAKEEKERRAAMRIQCRRRQVQAKAAAQKRRGIQSLSLFLLPAPEETKQRELYRARAVLLRKADITMRERDVAATAIQSYARRWLSTRRVKELARLRAIERQQFKAAQSIQKHARRKLVKKKVERRRENKKTDDVRRSYLKYKKGVEAKKWLEEETENNRLRNEMKERKRMFKEEKRTRKCIAVAIEENAATLRIQTRVRIMAAKKELQHRVGEARVKRMNEMYEKEREAKKAADEARKAREAKTKKKMKRR
jgi:hypothetical protein